MGKGLGETKPLVEHQVAVSPSRTRALRAATRTLPHGAYEPRKRIWRLVAACEPSFRVLDRTLW